jgi:hypothetical protein
VHPSAEEHISLEADSGARQRGTALEQVLNVLIFELV